jgi:hypothetical protein
MDEDKSFAEQLKKKIEKLPIKFFSTERGMAALEAVLRAKSKTDRRLTRAFHLAGLPSLQDKSDVEGVIRRQTRRLREVTDGLDEMEEAIIRLEKSLAQIAEPVAAKEAAVIPMAVRRTKTKPASKPKKSAKKSKPPVVKPQPLGAARKAAKPTSAKSLLDLNFKKR